jgi:adenylate cyclase
MRRSPHLYGHAARWQAAALGHLGRTSEAKASLEKAIAASPARFQLYALNRPPWVRPEDYIHMVEGLRKAGWDG